MRVRWLLVTVLSLGCASAHSQIYTCTAEDGTRIFSDERCGPDAKIVPGITTKKRSSGAGDQPRAPKSEAELQQLIEQCNAGDMQACREWTHGGGPNYLKEQERKAGQACEAGSLADCETRYCRDGITAECRRRVLETAKVSGETWYLREQATRADGAVAYAIRCVKEGVREIRDETVTCAGPPGPKRCVVSGTKQGFARLDQAAAAYCAT